MLADYTQNGMQRVDASAELRLRLHLGTGMFAVSMSQLLMFILNLVPPPTTKLIYLMDFGFIAFAIFFLQPWFVSPPKMTDEPPKMD